MPASRERLFAALVVLLVGGSVAVLVFETWQVQAQLDDAFISYRYARHLAEGAGLVYNVGERVEGFTNLLFTLLVALGVRIGLEAALCGHVIGVVSAAVLLIATWAYAATGLPAARRPWAALAPLLLLSHPAVVRWAESGMESTLFSACLAVALACQARERRIAATASLLAAALTRPEGALFAGLVFGLDLLGGWRERRRWWGPVALALLLLALTGFRLAYFGSPLPNTFYAKVSTQAPWAFGAAVVGAFLANGVLLWLPALVVAPLLEPRFRTGAWLVVCGLIYVIAIGGDTIGATRFLLPVMAPLAALAVRAPELVRGRPVASVALALLAAAGAAWQLIGPAPVLIGGVFIALAASISLLRAPGARVGAGVALLAAVLLGALSAPAWRGPFTAALADPRTAWMSAALGLPAPAPTPSPTLVERRRRDVIEHVRDANDTAKQLAGMQARRMVAREPALVALSGIGYFGYASRLPVLDLLGLVDATVARTPIPPDAPDLPLPGHQRSNAGYVLSRRPDYILMGRNGEPSYLRAHRELLAHPDFEATYVWDGDVGGYRLRASR